MKTNTEAKPERPQFRRNQSDPLNCMNKYLSLPVFLCGLLFVVLSADASNILNNPSFETNSGHVVASSWTYFSPPTPPGYFGDYWVESRAGIPHSGTLYWKQWGALYNSAVTNVAGIYQDFSSAPGSSYQASGWFYTASSDLMGPNNRAWIEVRFVGATSNLLALYKSDDFSASVGSDAWFQYQVNNACDLSTTVPSGDPYFTTYAVTGTVSQLVAPVGTKTVRYLYAFSQAGAEGGSAYLDDAVLDQVAGPLPPVISGVFPLNMIFVNPNDGVSFTVSSPSGYTINDNAIGLVLNGVDVSSNLAISGSSSNKNVTYHGLQSNLTYTASISVTDSFNFTASVNTYFETTWVGIPPVVYLWEAEDFDFTNGMYINFPDLCNAAGDPNCYFGKVGVAEVDEHGTGTGGDHTYRPDDLIPTGVSGDYLRKNLVDAGRTDYAINPFNGGSWLNYTRDWSNGTYWVIGRLATDIGLSGSLTLSQVNPDSTTTDLGTFSIAHGKGWTAFENVYLMDTNGNFAAITFSNKATLRVTSGGNLLPNFFALVAGQIDLPIVKNLYPNTSQPFEYTNTLSFRVMTTGATFPANGIQVNLDGVDVSSNLIITGSSTVKDVVYTNLLPNAVHMAILNITNSLSHGVSITNGFDTFTQDNYMVEAEDFDFGGGQFVDPWSPGAYATVSSVTNVDYKHISLTDQQYQYRPDGIPQAKTQDFLRDEFINAGETDYDLAWFGAPDWANYTRVYPTGNFYVYGRFAGGSGITYSMYLDQVVNGTGTVSQVTQRLGHWSALGRDYNLHDWVRLTDDGLTAPVVVKLGGLETLRITTDGFCNPNFFMLVPTSGIVLTAGHSGGNSVLSFPSQAGVTYRVLYRDDLVSGNWTLLTTVVGDGSVKSVTDSTAGGKRFYQVVAP
jgi:hypothetical protein